MCISVYALLKTRFFLKTRLGLRVCGPTASGSPNHTTDTPLSSRAAGLFLLLLSMARGGGEVRRTPIV